MCEQYTQLPLVAEIKRCSRCGETKPFAAFHRHARSRDGYHSYCKHCSSAHAAAWYVDNIERVHAKESVYRAANRDKARARSVARSVAKKEAIAAQQAAWYAKNKERVSVRGAAYYAANKEKVAARTATWRAANPHKTRAKSSRYRARKRGVPVLTFTAAQWQELIDEYLGRCAYCGCKPDVLTQDHVIPLSRGGNHTKENIVPACVSCNSSKRAKLLSEWKRPIKES